MSSYSNSQINLDNPNSSWTILYNYIKPNSRVLDIGCSSGYFARVLIEKKQCIVDGIELDHKDAMRAKQICSLLVEDNVETMDLKNSGLQDNYDVIVFADVLEHLVDPAKTLKKVSSLIKNTGQIIFSVPNMANGSIRLQLLQGNFDAEPEGLLDVTHLRFYTQNTIISLISAAQLYLHKFDFTVFDTPNNIVEAVLKNVGLKSTKDFVEFINSKDSLIYQFLGIARKSPAPKKIELTKITEAIKPQMLYDQQLRSIQKEAHSIFQSMTKSNKISNEAIELLKKEDQQLRLEIVRLQERPLNKVVRKLRNVKYYGKK